MIDIFNDSDDNSSDVPSVSNRRLSKLVCNIDENDDTKEKKEKRKSVLHETAINNIMPSSQLPTYTVKEVENHYGNCIKLASENKINSKNAFSLHLIDYLQTYVKEFIHFKSVVSSLDAGHKIYASRVDSVHQNTYQVLTGLGNPNEETKLNDIDNNDDIEESPENPVIDEELDSKAKRNRRKVNKVKNTICQNMKKIRIHSSQIRSEVDPLFQSQAENFDEGGNCELRLNNLRLLDSTFDLLLDSEKIVRTNMIEDQLVTNNDNLEWFDISSYGHLFSDLKTGLIPISSVFEDFMFTGWTETSEIMNSTTAESFRNMINEASKMVNDHSVMDNTILNEAMEYNDYDDDNGFDDANNNMETNYETNKENKLVDDIQVDKLVDNIQEDLDPSVIMRDDVEDDINDDTITLPNNKSNSCVVDMLTDSVRALVNSYIEQHGDDDFMSGTRIGINYWNQKTKTTKRRMVAIEEKPAKQPKVLKSLISSQIRTRLNDNGVGRMVIEHTWTFTKSDETSTQLTEGCLNKNVNKDYILPPKSNSSFKSINQMMNREVSLVNKAFKKHIVELSEFDVNGEEKIINNENNNILQISPKEDFIADDDGNITINNHDDNNNGDFDDDLYDGDAYDGTSYHDFNDMEEPVTANIKHVEQIDIDYAKSAKRINVKKLKSEMRSVFESKLQCVEMAKIEEAKYPNLYRNPNKYLFSELIAAVDGKMSDDASKDLSVSILLTCLLHLSNETGLSISNNDDYTDLIIGQGYSDYDIEQIELFSRAGAVDEDHNSDENENRPPLKLRKKKMVSNVFSEDED